MSRISLLKTGEIGRLFYFVPMMLHKRGILGNNQNGLVFRHKPRLLPQILHHANEITYFSFLSKLICDCRIQLHFSFCEILVNNDFFYINFVFYKFQKFLLSLKLSASSFQFPERLSHFNPRRKTRFKRKRTHAPHLFHLFPHVGFRKPYMWPLAQMHRLRICIAPNFLKDTLGGKWNKWSRYHGKRLQDFARGLQRESGVFPAVFE